MRYAAIVFCTLILSATVVAQILGNGTWVKREDSATRMMMIVEQAGTGRKITYKLLLPDGKTDDKFVSTVLTGLDGKDAPMLINGQPTGQTMGIRLIDSNHAFAVLKFQGKEFGTAKAEISADGKVLKVEDEITFAQPGQDVGKQIEYWDRK